MRINDIMQVSNPYRPGSPQSRATAAKAQAREEYSPSGAAVDYHIARRALQKSPEVRQSLIDDISARINAGTYQVGADEVAAAIIG